MTTIKLSLPFYKPDDIYNDPSVDPQLSSELGFPVHRLSRNNATFVCDECNATLSLFYETPEAISEACTRVPKKCPECGAQMRGIGMAI